MGAIEDALAAMQRIDEHEAASEQARRERDEAIWRAFAEEAMTTPAIWRALDKRVSESLVRNVVSVQKKVAKARGMK